MVSVYSASGAVSSKEGRRAEQFLQVVKPISASSAFARYEHAAQWVQDFSDEHRDVLTLRARAFEVAIIAAGLQVDPEVIIAALLLPFYGKHSLLEREFGTAVMHLVAGVRRMDVIDAHIKSATSTQQARANAEALRKMLIAMVQDVRVAVLKLAERLYLLRHIDEMPVDLQRPLAQDSLHYFAPLANRLGIWQIKWELEDLAFRSLQPVEYKAIAQRLSERRVDRERYLGELIAVLDQALAQAGIHATVVGRAKHIYSIFRKMQRKDRPLEQIYDIRAVRILVPEVKDCYAALGIVHSLWTFISDQFDDYIATPKDNEYKSIHTAVRGPGGKAVEVQIRTHEMHEYNEFGVAAHWRYKEGVRRDVTLDQKINWLRQVLQWGDELAVAGAMVSAVGNGLLQGRVYVFTPGGDVVDLPRGSTPLDFAYHVHTELGHHCRGAKVNGTMVPLTQVLETTDCVEVLTTKQGGPSRDWLNPEHGYLRSPKARVKVAHWFRQEDQQRMVDLGRQILTRELTRMNKREDVRVESAAKRLGFSTDNMLLAAIGRGDVRVVQVIEACERAPEPEHHPLENDFGYTVTPVITSRRQEASLARQPGSVLVVGVDNLLTHLAHCCHPIPGDEISGFITRGRGVTIHRANCGQLARLATPMPERVIEVSWGQAARQQFLCVIAVTAMERPGLLRDASQLIEEEQIAVVGATLAVQHRTREATMRFTVSIATLEQLKKVMSHIHQLPGVLSVRRYGV